MATNLQNHQESQEHSKGSMANNGTPMSDTGSNNFNSMISFTVDQPHHEHLLALDCDDSSTVFDSPLSHPVGVQNPSNHKTETRCFLTNFGKRSHMEEEMSSTGENPHLDLSLKLAPPWINLKDESPNDSVSSSTPSLCSRISRKQNPSVPLSEKNTVDGPSLILMGCQHCYMYVFVTELDPKCPKCRNDFLLDVFRDSSTKKTRKN